MTDNIIGIEVVGDPTLQPDEYRLSTCHHNWVLPRPTYCLKCGVTKPFHHRDQADLVKIDQLAAENMELRKQLATVREEAWTEAVALVANTCNAFVYCIPINGTCSATDCSVLGVLRAKYKEGRRC